MGCASSSLLTHDDDITQLGSTALGHHFVKLTSSTYGLLNLDPPQPDNTPTGPARFTLGSIFAEAKPLRRTEPEVINSWELMAGLDADSFRFSPLPQPKPKPRPPSPDKENFDPNVPNPLGKFERLSTPAGEGRVVLYTTTLRGVRSTFEACNAVRAAVEGCGVAVCERDVSMDRRFREELRELMGRKGKDPALPPRLFVDGRYVGGAEEVLRMAEDGGLADLLRGLPKRRIRDVCEGCGGAGFLPCFRCHGSCKMVIATATAGTAPGRRRSTVTVRCPDCNENGLVLCPICS